MSKTIADLTPEDYQKALEDSSKDQEKILLEAKVKNWRNMSKRPSVDIVEKQWRERILGIARKYFTEDEIHLIGDYANVWSVAAYEDQGKMGVEFSLESLSKFLSEIKKLRNKKESK